MKNIRTEESNIMTKADFKRDEQGRTILGTAKEIAEWMRLNLRRD